MELCFPKDNFKNWKNFGHGLADYGTYDLNAKHVQLININCMVTIHAVFFFKKYFFSLS